MKFNFSKITMSLIAVSLVFGLTACFNNNKAEPETNDSHDSILYDDASYQDSDEINTFNHPHSGISFLYSYEWQFMDFSEENTVLAFLMLEYPEGEFLSSLNFLTIDNSDEDTINLINEDMITQLENTGATDINSTEDSPRMINGIEFKSKTTTFKTAEQSEIKQTLLHYLDEKSSILYVIIINLSDNNENLNKIDEILDTYTISK